MNKETWLLIVEGDLQAYEQLYCHYYRRLYNYGCKFTGDTLLIEDCVQEFFMDIWTKKEKLLEVESFNSYFFAAFRYILFRKIRYSRRTTSTDNWAEPNFSADQISIDRTLDEALNQRLQTALLSLTTRQREAIFLRFYEGLSYEEVSLVLGISVKGTYKIIARSLSSLKSNMSLTGAGILAVIRLVPLEEIS